MSDNCKYRNRNNWLPLESVFQTLNVYYVGDAFSAYFHQTEKFLNFDAERRHPPWRWATTFSSTKCDRRHVRRSQTSLSRWWVRRQRRFRDVQMSSSSLFWQSRRKRRIKTVVSSLLFQKQEKLYFSLIVIFRRLTFLSKVEGVKNVNCISWNIFSKTYFLLLLETASIKCTFSLFITSWKDLKQSNTSLLFLVLDWKINLLLIMFNSWFLLLSLHNSNNEGHRGNLSPERKLRSELSTKWMMMIMIFHSLRRSLSDRKTRSHNHDWRRKSIIRQWCQRGRLVVETNSLFSLFWLEMWKSG